MPKIRSERVQYRQRDFEEPKLDRVLKLFENNIYLQIESLIREFNSVKFFDPEFAMVAIPLRRTLDTIQSLKYMNVKIPDRKLNSLKQLDHTLFDFIF